MENKGLILSPILREGMVLQRDKTNRIYGTDSLAEMVTVSFNGKEYCARVSDNHEFSVELPPVPSGGPYCITVKGSSEITISDILFGDVYILSGQSNMELPVRRVLDVSAEEVSRTNILEIRQYLIPATFNFKEPEKYMCAAEWKKATGDAIMDFSAVGLFFAKEIWEKYHVPVGLIMTAVGGSTIESWMNPVTLRRFGSFEAEVEDFQDIHYFHSFIQKQQEDANKWLEAIEKEEEHFDFSKEYLKWNTCRIPSLVSDYMDEPFSGSVYLCRELYLGSEQKEDNAYIYMGSIIDSDRVWINGTLIGRTEYRYPPRKYSIPKGVLKKGYNLITVRIVINQNNGGTIAGKPYHVYYNGETINLEGDWYYKVGKKSNTVMPSVLFPPLLPIGFYNATVVPLAKIQINGVLWYQGESNTGRPKDYADEFAAMVSDWRKLFGWEVPFIYVQLPNYREPLNTTEDTGWAELRDQQRKSLSLPKVAMVTALDVGEWNDLHPQNKKIIGVRLAKAAMHLIYKENIVYSGPIPNEISTIENCVIISFQHLEDTKQEQLLTNFEIAGEDGCFYEASAIRKGRCVYLTSKRVNTPVSVRYAWCDNPTNINFFNDAGLPATGFRMDIQ